MEPLVSAQLVRETACEMEAIIRHLKGNLPDWLTGYRVKILEVMLSSGSEHRLKPLRSCNSAPLPRQSLVVLDPVLMLAIDVFPTCTRKFLSGIVAQKGFFIIRQHLCFPWHNGSDFHYIGLVKGGKVFEQIITVSDDDGYLSTIRRVKVVLDEATRDGSYKIFILTNLPRTEVNALLVAQLYRKRWTQGNIISNPNSNF